jgi:hypothetical protein
MSSESSTIQSTPVDLILKQFAKEDCEYFQQKFLTGVHTVARDIIRKLEDNRFDAIVQKSQNTTFHTFEYPEKKPASPRTAEEWFGDFFKQNEKQKDPAAPIRNDMAQKRWKEMTEEEKQSFVVKAEEDKIRFEKENKHYMDQKKLVPLTSGQTLRVFQDWNDNVNEFLHEVEPKLNRTVMAMSAQMEKLTSAPTYSLAPPSNPLASRSSKRKREALVGTGTGSKVNYGGRTANQSHASKPKPVTNRGKTKRPRQDILNEDSFSEKPLTAGEMQTQAPSRATKASQSRASNREGKTSTRRGGKGSQKGSSEEKKTRTRARNTEKAGIPKGSKPGNGPYNLFKAKYKLKYPDLAKSLSAADFSQKVSSEWHDMSQEEKQPIYIEWQQTKQGNVNANSSARIGDSLSPADPSDPKVVTTAASEIKKPLNNNRPPPIQPPTNQDLNSPNSAQSTVSSTSGTPQSGLTQSFFDSPTEEKNDYNFDSGDTEFTDW